jgi:hypothetical protein
MALRAKRSLITSCSVMPPHAWTVWFKSSRAPSELMMIGTSQRPHVATSSSQRGFDPCTIWLTANGAAGSSGWSRSHAANASVISCSHSSSCVWGRALSAGNDPITPAVHSAITSAGVETRNIGAAITGRRRRSVRTAGSSITKAYLTSDSEVNSWYARRQ